MFSLIGANELNICVLRDVSNRDKQRVENLTKHPFLNRNSIIQLNEFADKQEADIEDLFSIEEYLSLVKAAYPAVKDTLSVEVLSKLPRFVKRLEKFFSENVTDTRFNHFAPARIGLSELGKNIPISAETMNRFEQLFKRLNKQLSAE